MWYLCLSIYAWQMYTLVVQVIDRKIRELNVECILLPLNTSVASLKEKGVWYVKCHLLWH